jgi:DNA-directed RNA polymerase alpha subunit
MKITSIVQKYFVEIINNSSVSDREKDVLTMRLKGETLENIGSYIKPIREFDSQTVDGKLDGERIRQIETKGLMKLKSYYKKFDTDLRELEEKLWKSEQLCEYQSKLLDKIKNLAETPIEERYFVDKGRNVRHLDLPTRVANALIRAGFEYEYDIKNIETKTLLKVRNIGPRGVDIIYKAIGFKG